MVSIGVCEQQEMVREALAKAIAPMKGVTVLVAEHDGESFLQGVQQHRPDVMIVNVDGASGNGTEIARRARALNGNGKLVALVDQENDAALVKSYEMGASAVVSKARPVRDLHKVVLDVAANGGMIDPASVRTAKKRLEESGHAALSRIDATDRKMLQLLTLGYSDRQIAAEVYLSLQTVRNRMSRLLQKFRLDNRTQLALHVERLGVFANEPSLAIMPPSQTSNGAAVSRTASPAVSRAVSPAASRAVSPAASRTSSTASRATSLVGTPPTRKE